MNLFQYDSKNWISFLKYESQKWTFFLKRWLKDLNPFLNVTQKNWTSFLNMTQRMLFFNMTLRIEPFLHMTLRPFISRLKEVELFLLKVTARIEHFLKICLKELNLFFTNMTPKNWTFFSSIWLQKLNLFFNFFKNDSQIWTLLFSMTQRNWIFSIERFFSAWFTEIEPQRIELFTMWLKELNSFDYWLKELNFFSWRWRKELNLILKWFKEPIFFIFQNIVFFEYDSNNWTIEKMTGFWGGENSNCRTLLFDDSKNWLLFNMTHRTEPFLMITELNPSFQHNS